MAKRSLKYILIVTLLITLLVSPFVNVRVRAQDTGPGGSTGESPSQSGATQSAVPVPGASRVAYHAQTGLVSFIGTQVGQAIPQPSPLPQDASPEAAALNFLAAYSELFGLHGPSSSLSAMVVETADNGRSFVRFQQSYQSVPVIGGELIVQMDARQDVLSVNGEVLPPDESLSVTPEVGEDAAMTEAKAVVAKTYNLEAEGLSVTKPELWIYSPALLGAPGDQRNRTVWRMEVNPVELLPVRELVLVDAHTGSVALHFNQIDSVKNRQIYNNNNDYTRGLPGTGGIVRAEGGAATGNADVDRAYDYSGNTYDFYFNTHARDSLDGLGMPMISTVNYCPNSSSCPYQNAFWNSVQMVYGQGFAAADDVVAHELTHGVTENESNLFYYMQSGAINESFSDIWGEFVDLTYDGPNDNDTAGVRWLLGEDVPGFGAIRNMANPPAFGDPDAMGSGNYYCGPQDNGGVHWNSGVSNKAAYLITDGGLFNGYSITGIGITKAAKIFYEVQAHMLTSAADYQDLAESLSQACNNLVGTSGITEANCSQVREAIAAVEMTKQPVACAANEAPVCDVYGFNSTFNSSLAGWTEASGSWGFTSQYATTNGAPETYSSLVSNGSYGDFEYTATMRRSGCETCANGVFIRGTPAPLQTQNRWNTGYLFQYTRNGDVSVFVLVGTSYIPLRDWVPSEAVNIGTAWNTMKIIARGNQLFYYLNDDLVWSGMVSNYAYGKVGLTMFRNNTSTGDLLEVDAASLAGGTPVPLFSDSFEHGLEYWSHTATVGADEWYHETQYATAGNYELYGYAQGAISDSYARMKNPVSLPGGQNAFLHFRHAYDFEGTSAAWDGGVIEYSTNNGSTWSDAAPLVVNNGYNATIEDGFGNPLANRNGFGLASNGYISTRLNLTSLAGNSFLVRFRIGTDNVNSDLGWLIDEAQVYTCAERDASLYLPVQMRSGPATSFDYQFTDSNRGWTPQAGAWTVNGGTMGTAGVPNASSSASYWHPFTNLDYSVRMRRFGCSGCANRIMVRGTPLPLIATRHWPANYFFQYNNGGEYSVFKRVGGGAETALQPWTLSPAIVSGGYNLLRVVANGTSLSFYINGTLVWSGSDPSLTTGLVGVGMYRDGYSTNNWLDVDYATLTNGTTSLAGAEMSQEQGSLDLAPASGGSADMSPQE